MKLLFRISPDNVINSYNRIVRALHGNDQLAFEAMASVVQRQKMATFEPPGSQVEYETKHKEIESRLRRNSVQGRELAFLWTEELLDLANQRGGIPGISTQVFADQLFFETIDSDICIRLGTSNRWAAEWKVQLSHRGTREERNVAVDIHSRDWGEIVPSYVLEYVSSALMCYRNGMYATAVALLTISVEATLRDVLGEAGYSYDPRAPTVDEYPFTEAHVGVDGTKYTVTFDDTMLPSTTGFLQCLDGQTEANISVRRIIKERKNGKRVDLHILAPQCLVEHWSPNAPDKFAQHTLSGLGAALRVARDKKKIVTAEMLPLDFEEVLVTVRNNLVHLSGAALDTELAMFNFQEPFTLHDFLDNPEMVFDFIISIPEFINVLYIGLREGKLSRDGLD